MFHRFEGFSKNFGIFEIPIIKSDYLAASWNHDIIVIESEVETELAMPQRILIFEYE